MRRWLRRALKAGAVCAALALGGWVALDRWVAATELPPLDVPLSVTVEDRGGRLLRAYTVADGRWRLPVSLAEVDRGYVAQLVAYEDKRFYDHSGVDFLALVRAAWQAAVNGRVVSGASTLTMQVARLLEEGPTGDVGGKIRQIRVALALERRLSKDEILALYLRLAPYGGNLEGVRAASLSWFGKEPRRLTPAEAALLVALPQAPEGRRPDRHHAAAKAARDRVLDRVAEAGALAADEAAAAKVEAVPRATRPFPMLAPHLADRAVAEAPGEGVVRLTLDGHVQARLEDLLRDRARQMDPSLSAAVLVVDHRTGEVVASLGSPDLFDTRRRGFVDMTRAVRSPGSTLKPLIYGLGFEMGLAHPEMMIEDRPMSFGAYAPTNFDNIYRGLVPVRRALQLSLNIPAVAVLDSVGPAHLVARMKRAGAAPQLPPGEAPGLAIGLGGIGVTLRELVALYAAMARGGEAVVLRDRADAPLATGAPVLSPVAAWYIGDILVGAPPPAGAAQKGIAYKTGTSYGHRDAWAVGFDGRHAIGVWIGRPDAAASPGMIGIDMAAPILFEAFGRLKPKPEPLAPPPGEALTVSNPELPAPLRRFRGAGEIILSDHAEPEIAFPPDGARVEIGAGGALVVKVRDGAPPFTWLIDGRPVEAFPWDREVSWMPPGPGFVSISVIDARGDAARARVFVE